MKDTPTKLNRNRNPRGFNESAEQAFQAALPRFKSYRSPGSCLWHSQVYERRRKLLQGGT